MILNSIRGDASSANATTFDREPPESCYDPDWMARDARPHDTARTKGALRVCFEINQLEIDELATSNSPNAEPISVMYAAGEEGCPIFS